MKAKKILIIIAVVIVLGGAIVAFTVNTQKNVIAVQTGKVVLQDIASQVTASGEIKPKTFVNVGANAQGRITRLFVAEGQKVKRGQILAQLENVQSAADVSAMKAALSNSQTDAVALDAAVKTAQAALNSSRATLAHSKIDYDLYPGLGTNQLVSRTDFHPQKSKDYVDTASRPQHHATPAPT